MVLTVLSTQVYVLKILLNSSFDCALDSRQTYCVLVNDGINWLNGMFF